MKQLILLAIVLVAACSAAFGQVGTQQIQNGAITGPKIAAGAIDPSKVSATGTPSSTTFWRGDNTWAVPAGGGGGGSGTVTSVGLSLPAEFNLTGSPITSAGTLMATWATEGANTVFAGPASGSGPPGFRTLVGNDIPVDGTTIQSSGGVIVGVQGATGIDQLTGDATAGPGVGSQAITLATVNTSPGSTGDASHTSAIVTNGKGLVTSNTSTAIQIAESAVTGLLTSLAALQPLGNYITALTGDVTASGPGSAAATVAKVNGVPYSSTSPTQNQVPRWNAADGQVEYSALAELQPCLAVATSNVSSLSGTTTIDGQALAAGKNVLLTAQSTASQNGIWTVEPGSWVRPASYSSGSSVPPSAYTCIAGGTVYHNSIWQLTGFTSAITVDTTATTWAQIQAIPEGSITTTAPLTGGGTLASGLTIGVNTFGSSQPGVVPSSGGGTTNYLRADGTWAAPAGTGVTSIGVTAPITSTGGTTPTIGVNTMVAAGSSHAAGIVPDPGSTSHSPAYVLGDDAAWHAAFWGFYYVDYVYDSNLSSLSGTTVNGYSCVSGDTILLTDQTTASQDGVYVIGAGSWSRASWMASGLVITVPQTLVLYVGSSVDTTQDNIDTFYELDASSSGTASSFTVGGSTAPTWLYAGDYLEYLRDVQWNEGAGLTDGAVLTYNYAANAWRPQIPIGSVSVTAPDSVTGSIVSYDSSSNAYVSFQANWGVTSPYTSDVAAEAGGETKWQYSTDDSTWKGPDGTSSTWYKVKGSRWLCPHGIASGNLYAQCEDVTANGSASGAVASSAVAYASPPSPGGGIFGGSGANVSEMSGNANYTLGSSLAVLQATAQSPLQQTLPAGNYLLQANIPVLEAAYADDDIEAEFYNQTASAAISGSLCQISSLPASTYGQLHLEKYITLASTSVIQIWAANVSAARGTIAAVNSGLVYDIVGANNTAGNYAPITQYWMQPNFGTSATVNIYGIGFTGATAVSFNGTAASSFTVNSDTNITATTPSSFTGGTIAVTGPGGTSTSVLQEYTTEQDFTSLLLHCDGTSGSTAFTDSSSYGQTVTATNCTVNTSHVEFGTGSAAMSGSGTSSGLSVPSNSIYAFGTGAFTIEFWVNFTTLPSSGNISFYLQTTSSNFIQLLYAASSSTSGTIELGVNTAGSMVTSTTWSPGTGVWHHIAVVRDASSNMYVFLDGVKSNSAATSSTSIGTYTSALQLGYNSGTTAQTLGGYMDEIRVSKGIARYTYNFTPPTVPYLAD